jgi:hypothetical protein
MIEAYISNNLHNEYLPKYIRNNNQSGITVPSVLSTPLFRFTTIDS